MRSEGLNGAGVVLLRGRRHPVYSIWNAHWEPLDFDLPPLDQEYGPFWRRWIDTSLDSPNDFAQWQHAPAVPCSTYRAEAHSVVALFADSGR
jgi:isoamylase